MWHNSRRGRNLIKQRYSVRGTKEKIIFGLQLTAILLVICAVIIAILFMISNFENSPIQPVVPNDNDISIYEDDTNYNDENEDEYENPNQLERTFIFSAIGEIMLGGVGEGYRYMSSFKDVAEYTSVADYTVANLTTNIVDVDELENTSSKYVVTKDVLDSLSALGVDGVNIASDHMLDFGENIFKGTVGFLTAADYDVIGLSSEIVYAENNGIKIAFIGINNEIIGMYSKYVNAGMRMYDNYMVNIKKIISESKERADMVVVMTHLGQENTHMVTSVMSWFYKEIIKCGADMVLGSHALGVYPIEFYEGKPIIYSLGYFVHDTSYTIGRKSGIFNFTIDEKGTLTKIEVIPTYINSGRQPVLYRDYNAKDAIAFLNYIMPVRENWYTSKIQNGKLIIDIKKEG